MCTRVYLAAGLLAFALGSSSQDRQPSQGGSAFMQLKLKAAQQALNGLAVADFGMVETSGRDLARLSRKAEFQLMRTPAYERHSDEFRRSAEAMADAAHGKNLDGAALAYVQLTLACVSCHKHLRDVP
jgi:hypothetical protein